MHYRPLGQTGMHVSTLGLGTMMFGAVGNPDAADCARILHAALDAGINLVDTADMYSAGEAETIVGEALKGRRGEVILATKGHFPVGTEDRNPPRQLPAPPHGSRRGQSAAAAHRLDRPLPGAPARSRHRHRRDARHPR